jgi:hypothetical protein
MHRTTRTIAALLPLSIALLAASARAAQDEHALSLGPRYAGVFTTGDDAHGVGLAVGYRYGLSDFFTLLVDGGYAVLPAEPEHFAFVRVGATYTIDALEWVPWLGLALGGYVAPNPDARLDGGASAGVGLDYRAQREWSVGVEVWYHALFRQLDTVPAVLTAGLNLTWYLE